MVEYVNINGDPVKTDGPASPKKKKAAAFKKTEDREAATISRGFFVLGHPPGRADEVAITWQRLVDEHKAEPKKTKHPGPRELFMLKGRKKVVARPYELAESAELCVKLAKSIGWTHVTINEDLERPA